MSRRVILGKHPSKAAYGLWVSKPGLDAASLTASDLLIDTTSFNSQPIISNSISNFRLTKNTTKSTEKSNQYNFNNPGAGNICYDYEIPYGFNLGYTPVCFITYSSADAGGPYPRVLVKSDRLVLEYWQYQQEYPATYNQFFGYQWLYRTPDAYYDFGITIYYTIFRQSITDTLPVGSTTGVPRVIANSSRLKVSRDGYNVNTATQSQTAFEVDFSASTANQLGYSGVFLSGTAKTNDGTWQTAFLGNTFFGQQEIQRQFKIIPFGKTFSKPPQILYSLRNLNNTAAGGYQRYSAIQNVTNGTIGTVAWVSASTTELTLRVDFNRYGTAVGSRDWEFSYVVFQS